MTLPPSHPRSGLARTAGVQGRERPHQAAPQARPARAPAGLVALQAAAGNAAVLQMLREAGHPWAQEQHQHGAGCGHQQTERSAPAVQRSAVHDVLRTAGRPLDDATRTDMESRLGADFSDVRVHADAAAKASAAEVGARAYTSGNHVVIGDGGGDKHTLAHELTHVIQQRLGPVAGTDNGSGLKVSDPSDRFEREAEANARTVMRASRPVQRKSRGESSAAPVGTVVQRGKSGKAKSFYASRPSMSESLTNGLTGRTPATSSRTLNPYENYVGKAKDKTGKYHLQDMEVDRNHRLSYQGTYELLDSAIRKSATFGSTIINGLVNLTGGGQKATAASERAFKLRKEISTLGAMYDDSVNVSDLKALGTKSGTSAQVVGKIKSYVKFLHDAAHSTADTITNLRGGDASTNRSISDRFDPGMTATGAITPTSRSLMDYVRGAAQRGDTSPRIAEFADPLTDANGNNVSSSDPRAIDVKELERRLKNL
ncbi:DUF4157 domain-containing protein [Streptomyces sp. NPDC056517]|uniref:eCIS core domain-containing protein n=1 Tax=Streptomyces sp. NPDC056517 TaxID=3345848 RepID=UPI00368D84DC